MNLIRAFIAIPIPATLQTTIRQGTASLQQEAGSKLVRWVPVQNMHLTLKFLGDISEADVDTLKAALKKEMESQPAFEITLKGLGAFPSISRPRVVWLGVEDKGSFLALQRCAERVASQIGVEPNKGKFSAHLTLGRVRRQVRKAGKDQIRRAILAHQDVNFGTLGAEQVHLYQSKLGATGAVYRSLFAVQLNRSL